MATDLIFDFFGTLVRYTHGTFAGDRYSRTHRFLLEHGFPVQYERMVDRFQAACQQLDDEARRTLIEFHMHEAGRLFFEDCFEQSPPDELIAEFIVVFQKEWDRGTTFYPGIESFLTRLASRHRLSIISNTQYPPLVPQNLAAMGVSQHFAHVVTSVDFGVRKPNPRIFQEALTRLGIDATQAIYIGDNFEDDYKGATDAGLRCILVDPNRKWKDVVEDRVDALFDLVELLGIESSP